MKDLSIRVTSGIIGLSLLIAVLYTGGPVMAASIFAVSVIGLREFYKAMKSLNRKPDMIIGAIAALFISVDFLMKFSSTSLIFVAIVITLLSKTVLSEQFDIFDAAVTLIGIIYIPFLLGHTLLLDSTPYLWLIFLIAFGTDTFAYLIGSKFGKHKLSPKISPKKSVEGSFGGIVGSIVATLIYANLVNIEPALSLVTIALIGSIVSQLGDLSASKIKRLAGLKDFGRLMPGHGGMLDRFDSVLFTAPVVYYFVQIFLK